MPSDAQRLAHDGIPITLADGQPHRLYYGTRGLILLEESFDGLDNVTQFLRGEATRRFRPMHDMLVAGLVHEGLSADAVLDLAEPPRYKEYLTAVAEALDLAFPAPSEELGPKDPVPNGSTGEASTTSPPSVSDAAMTSSGA